MIVWIIATIIAGLLNCLVLGTRTYKDFCQKYPISKYLNLPKEERYLYSHYGKKNKKKLITVKDFLAFFFRTETLLSCLLVVLIGSAMYFTISMPLEYVIQMFDKSYHVITDTRNHITYIFLPSLYLFTNLIVIYIHLDTLKDELFKINQKEILDGMNIKESIYQ